MKKKFTLVAILFGSIAVQAQSDKALWTLTDEKNIVISGKREIVPDKYNTVHLDLNGLKQLLSQVPSDNNTLIKNSTGVISLPMPDGSFEKFKIVESPVMAEPLQISYPNIRTYSVHGIDDIYASGKLDLTEYGFHGMIRSPKGTVFIDPYCRNNTADYISYYTFNFTKPEKDRMVEIGVLGNETVAQKALSPTAMICSGANLRTYRLAIACTKEYAVAATGSATPTTAQTLAKVVTSVNRVDGVYETEAAIKLVLVPTTTLVLFTSATGSGFTTSDNSNATSLIGKSQSVITATVGSANFDIGHTFSTGGGGLANLGCVCTTNSKASGITGSPSPVGDAYDIDYVAHEMGHQFGGNHTFNNSSLGSCAGNRNASTSVEPGSGITIMAYAGICGTDNLASHSIAYFHSVSFDEIMAYSNTGNGNSCPVKTANRK